MIHHRASRYRPRRTGGPARWARLHSPSGTVLMVLAALVTTAVLVGALRRYEFEQSYKGRKAYWDAHFADIAAVEQHWLGAPALPPISTGDEPQVVRFLAQQPLVVALVDRSPGRAVWVREGDRLAPPRDPATSQRLLRWAGESEKSRGIEWIPPPALDPEAARAASIVLVTERWLIVKRWQPGTPEVERALVVALGAQPPARAGLVRTSQVVRRGDPVPDGRPEPWGMEPNLQVDAYSYNTAMQRTEGRSSAFGEGWTIISVAFAAQEQVFRNELRNRTWTAWAAGALVDLAIGLGLWLHYRARRRAVLETDRIASMTHSLKTPLALLKLRCDSIRLGHLSPERTGEELIQVGEEVDRLAAIIDTGLRALRGPAMHGEERQLATPEWLQEVVQEVRPSFEREGRALELKLDPAAGLAHLFSLRTALLTLLENALGHGGGRVTLETRRVRRRLCLRVSDEGEGLEPHQLAVLGKPFQRLRERGKEGFVREGLGLGLSLLAQLAEQEGWGLDFASGRGKGFAATLEIPATGS